MDWTEVAITVDAADVDRAGDIAQMVVPYGIYIEDYSHLEEEAWEIAHIDLIDEDLLKKDRTKGIIHVYISPEENPAEAISFLKDRYNADGIHYEISTADCAMEDWINNWKKYFKPMPVGQSLLIRPTWEDAYNPAGRRVLHIEPGLAFGTGTHETTRLCMELIEDYLRPQMDVLDVGCGSGILSVAALIMGARSATGVDIDELAVKTAAENAEINRVGDRFTAVAVYIGSATSSYVKGYTVTADYSGTVSHIALNRVRYVAIFEGTPIQPAEPVNVPSAASAFRWSYVLIPLGIVAAAGAGVGGALLVKHRKENADEEDATE